MTTASAAFAIPEVLPPATNSFRFSLFNAVNFQITLGAAMVLYAKALGGSATTIGIVASLAPLMTVVPLPTAYFITKVGYKDFVLFGWSVRSALLFILPLLAFLPSARFSWQSRSLKRKGSRSRPLFAMSSFWRA